MNVLTTALAGVGLALAFVAQVARWLRVLQREHYEAAAVPRFWRRWVWPSWADLRAVATPRDALFALSPVLFLVAVIGLVTSVLTHQSVAATAASVVYGVGCPWGLTPRGRTGRLQWTRRLRTVAAVQLAFSLVVLALGAWALNVIAAAAWVVVSVPLTLGLAAGALGPYERRQAGAFVDRARQRLNRVHPLVVAITGSYGKTSTKNHLADLLGGDGGVVATPKSFNNRAGLSRSINENLADDTRVFVAEMGTYGPGEIRDLCAWCPPDVSVVTAIGPVHLERMKSLDVIEGAKFEITERARTVILNVDDPRLVTWSTRLGDRRVRTAGSTNESADVRVVPEGEHWRVMVDGVDVATTPALRGVQPTNVACALAAALEVGAQVGELERRLRELRPVANRASVATAASGVVVVDDTFNANPASARASLALLEGLDAPRRVVVTPGLIELGERQAPENEELAREIARRGNELAVVGRSNRVALRRGFGADAHEFSDRDHAVAWVRSSLRAGDAVLYLNDLPDHYP